MKHVGRCILVSFMVLCAGGCSLLAPPPDLDVRTEKTSANGVYLVSMHRTEAAALNQIHAWEIVVTSGAGQPVDDVRFTLSGGMPQHFHSFPTKPRVTGALGRGRYVLGGVKFSMSGWWQFKLDLAGSRGSDTVVFNTVIGEQGTTLPQSELK